MRQTILRRLPVGLIGLGFVLLAIANSASAGGAAPAYVNAYAVPVGYSTYGYYGYGYGPGYPAVGYGYRDNRYCDDGNVIATSSGYFCANGSPLHMSGAAVPVYVGPSVAYTQAPIAVTVPQTTTHGPIMNGQEFK